MNWSRWVRLKPTNRRSMPVTRLGYALLAQRSAWASYCCAEPLNPWTKTTGNAASARAISLPSGPKASAAAIRVRRAERIPSFMVLSWTFPPSITPSAPQDKCKLNPASTSYRAPDRSSAPGDCLAGSALQAHRCTPDPGRGLHDRLGLFRGVAVDEVVVRDAHVHRVQRERGGPGVE